MKAQHNTQLGMTAVVLMLFTTVFGFNNINRSFYLMGYAAIPWYLLAGFGFFLPFAFMLAEMSAAFHKEHGGVYTWMERSVGSRFAFMGVFMWYMSILVWMIANSSLLSVPLSTAIFGHASSGDWSLWGLSTTQTLGLGGAFWVLIATVISTRGLKHISGITSVGGVAVASLNLLLLFGALLVVFTNKHVALPITWDAFRYSPNPDQSSVISVFAFLTYAFFAYGGTEITAGLVDKTKNPARTIPKALVVSATIITTGYSLGILLNGFFSNWQESLSGANLGDSSYVQMGFLGTAIGRALGISDPSVLGSAVGRFMGSAMLVTLCGVFLSLMYSPLRQMIEGTPKEMWHPSVLEHRNGIPVNAMWLQSAVVVTIVLLVSFGGSTIAAFFERVVLMMNVAMTIPYLFITVAYLFFLERTDIEKPLFLFRNKTFARVMTWVVIVCLSFGNIFAIIQPWLTDGNIASSLWILSGPLVSMLVALVIYQKYENKKRTQAH